MVITCGPGETLGSFIMNQIIYACTTGFDTKSSLSLTPFTILGSGMGLSLMLSSKERLSETQSYYGLYEIPRDGIEFILENGINEMRVPTRSKYVSFTGYTNGRYGHDFLSWLDSALYSVDERSLKSVNTIEDNL